MNKTAPTIMSSDPFLFQKLSSKQKPYRYYVCMKHKAIIAIVV